MIFINYITYENIKTLNFNLFCNILVDTFKSTLNIYSNQH